MELKLSEIRELYYGLESIMEVESEFDFSYGIAKNRRTLKSYVTHFEEKYKTTKEYEEYEKERVKLAYDMATLDEDGQPIIKNQSYIIKADLRDEFKDKLEDLKEKFKETIDKQKELSEKAENALNEVKQVEIYDISKSIVPKLTIKQMEAVFLFIKD